MIVDLIGLADPLATYANETGDSDKRIKELQDEAIPAMRSAFEQLRGFFHGCDYSAALDAEHTVTKTPYRAKGDPIRRPAISQAGLIALGRPLKKKSVENFPPFKNTGETAVSIEPRRVSLGMF